MKIESYSMLGIKKYQELFPESEKLFVTSIFCRHEFSYYLKKAMDKKIQNLEMLPGYPDTMFTTDYETYKGKRIPREKNGIWSIKFADKKEEKNVVLVKWLQGGSRGFDIHGVIVGVEKDIISFLNKMEKADKIDQRPRPGIYRAYMTPQGIAYEKKKLKEIPDTTVIHPSVQEINEHIDYYFGHVTDFCVNNMSGAKSILMHGQQGTGKTSLAYKIARAHRDDKCVAFITDVGALWGHAHNCAKHKVPTITIFEDCEAQFSRNNGEIKNFLSGIDAPQNKAGSYMIFTTNYPDKIEATIIRRKGRIDRLIKVGKLEGEHLKDCIRLYFDAKTEPGDLEKIQALVEERKLSGSEVEVLAQECLAYAAKQGELLVTDAMFRTIYQQMIEEADGIVYDETDYEMEPLEDTQGIGFHHHSMPK